MLRALGAATRVVCVACALVAGASAALRADDDSVTPTAPVALSFDACAPSVQEVVLNVVGLELAPRPVARADADSEPSAADRPTTVHVECQDSQAQIALREPDAGALLRLTLELGETAAEARPRLLALSVAELVVTSRMRARQRQAETATGAEREAETEAAHDPSATPRWRLRPWLAAGVMRQGAPPIAAPSLQLGVLAHRGLFGGFIDVRAEFASPDLDGTALDTWSVSGALGPSVALAWPSALLFVNAGLRAGYVQLGASSTEPDVRGEQLRAGWFGPSLALGTQLRLHGALALHLALEFAWAAPPLRGNDAAGDPLYAYEGPLLSAVAGLALWP